MSNKKSVCPSRLSQYKILEHIRTRCKVVLTSLLWHRFVRLSHCLPADEIERWHVQVSPVACFIRNVEINCQLIHYSDGGRGGTGGGRSTPDDVIIVQANFHVLKNGLATVRNASFFVTRIVPHIIVSNCSGQMCASCSVHPRLAARA